MHAFKISILFCSVILVSTINAQEPLVKSYQTGQVEEIEIEVTYGELDVTFVDEEELTIVWDLKINDEYQNEAIKIDDNIENRKIKIFSNLDFSNIDKKITIVTEEGDRIQMSSKAYVNRKIIQKDGETISYGHDIDGKIIVKIPRSKNIMIKAVYGDMEVKHSGDIGDSQLSFHSTYGHVDLAIPESTSSQIELSTSYGEIYSDLPFKVDFSGKNKNCGYGEKIKSTLNNGLQGSIALEATYDNIYLRKI